MKNYKYAGFISYAHSDEAVAARLHRALETYSIPKAIKSNISRDQLSPIFRDATELTVHHSLSETIQEAVQASRFLIVLCSPAAKTSHWVNEEIQLFRSLHGEQSILCVLSEGTPETSFPPVLLEGGREPLAANLSGGKDSFKLGVTQLAASMMGVGLNTLIQRESKRRRRRLQLVGAFALMFSAFMGLIAFTAIEARNEAQDSRAQAEGLVEYMITDLKEKLEPLGKLEVLDSVGDKAVEYYDVQNRKHLSPESLLRQARSRHIIAQVAIKTKNEEKAEQEIEAAYSLTQDVLTLNPHDTTSIYAHAQSEYWVGELNIMQEKHDKARAFWIRYDELAGQLYAIDPHNIEWVMEAGWGQNNLGAIARMLNEPETALPHFDHAIVYFDEILEMDTNNPSAMKEKSNALLGAAWAAGKLIDQKAAQKYLSENIQINETLLKQTPNDYNLKFDLIMAKTTAKRFDLAYDYNPIPELKELTLHDPKNVRWLHEYTYELSRVEP